MVAETVTETESNVNPVLVLTEEECLERSPFLVHLKKKGRLAPSRLEELLNAAKSVEAPEEPEPWECCGSKCKPCVKELWAEEKRVWKECHTE